MKTQFIKIGYNITTDSQFLNKNFGNTPELVKQLESLLYEARDKKNKKIIDKLNGLIIRYPESPQLKNFLSVAYSVRGKYKKAMEINDWILAEHPDYLFAKVNKAHDYLKKGEFAGVTRILGEAMELKNLYPERDMFHLAEITTFYKTAVNYFAAIEDFELAENRMEVLEEIAPDHHNTQEALACLMKHRMAMGLERYKKEEEQRMTPNVEKPLPLQKETAPQFNHPEINALYEFGLRIPHEELRRIIALPRETLIKDLELVLADAAERYEYFCDLNWEEEMNSFPLHAIFLLKEINAEESLIKVISFLEYDGDFLEFWLGDHVTTTLWQYFYGLGFYNTDTLKKLLLKPGIDTYVKTSVSEALCQMVLHHPEKKSEILNIYSEIFTFFAEAKPQDNIIDSAFLGLAIGDTLDCKLTELLPLIKPLYDKEYVSLGINGTFSDVLKHAEKDKIKEKKGIHSIFSLYSSVINEWAGYKENDTDFYKTPFQQAVSEKINRNEPCPCGSGKKHKKCCIDKK